MYRSITLTLFVLMIHSAVSAQELLITNAGDTITISIVEFKGDLLYYKKINSDKILISNFKFLNRLIYSNGDNFIFKKKKMIPRPEHKTYTPEMKRVAKEVGLLKFNNGFWAPSISNHEGKLSANRVMEIYTALYNLEAIKSFERGRRLNILGNILAIPSGFLFGHELYKEFDRPHRRNRIVLYSSAIVGVTSLFLNGVGLSLMKKSVENYNRDVSFHLEGTVHGFGMVLKF